MSSTVQPPAIGELLGKRRNELHFSLQELSRRSGVSKGMISQIENGQVNPTLAIVWKLAAGLGVRLQDLLEGAESGTTETAEVTYLTEENCPTLNSEKNGYRIQILSTVDMTEHVELYLVHFRMDGVMDSSPHPKGTFETLTVLKGEVEVSSGGITPRAVKTHQSVRYPADLRHVIRAKGKKESLCYLVVKHPLGPVE